MNIAGIHVLEIDSKLVDTYVQWKRCVYYYFLQAEELMRKIEKEEVSADTERGFLK